MIVDALLTFVLGLFDWFLSLGIPDTIFSVINQVSQGLDAFIDLLPQHPLIPYAQISLSIGIVLLVLASTVIYKLIRGIIGLFLG